MRAVQRHHRPRAGALSGVSVVICAYSERDWDTLVDAVASAEDQLPAPQEVLVVVDHDERLLSLATRALPQTRVIANEEARGSAGAMDTGSRHANGDVVAFLDAFRAAR
jgi:glycosyltransferase involved in cell wall biosynthesis